MSNSGIRAVLLGAAVNLVLAITKIAGGILGNTYALIADGIESTLDVFSSLVVASGLKIGALPPDQDHPFGHGKAESLAAMFVSFVLLGAAIAIAVGSVKEILLPSKSPAPFTLVILLVTIITKEVMFRRLIHAGKKAHSLSVQVDAWHHRSDALTSFAVFFGILITLVGGQAFQSADDWAALFASCIIGSNGIVLLNMSIQEIMDAAVDPSIISAIRLMATSVEGVKGIEKCKARKSGTYYFVEIHVEVDPNMTVRASHDLGHKVKDKLVDSPLPLADVIVHIEPA
jgi:cation diffusion facilitator family transporter